MGLELSRELYNKLSERSLTQTIGRAARNVRGKVIMYADKITDSMRKTIDETNRRRSLQQGYNKEHGITPQTINKSMEAILFQTAVADRQDGRKGKEYENEHKVSMAADPVIRELSSEQRQKLIDKLKGDMKSAAKDLDFIEAARLRDEIAALENMR